MQLRSGILQMGLAIIDEIEFSETLQLIYDAGLDFARWPAVLEQLADILGASMTCLVRHDVTTSDGAMIAIRTDPETSRHYADHYAKLNVFAQRAGKRPAATCMTDRSVLPKEKLFGSEFYADFLRPRDVHSILSVFLLRNGATRVALGRPHRAGDWEQEEIDCLNLFAPHLHRAAEMNVRLEGMRLSEAGMTKVLDHLAQGIIIVDAESRPVFVNGAADRILGQVDGLGINTGGICATRPAENAALQRMIATAANGQPESMRASELSVSRPSLRRPLSLMIAPLRNGGWFLPQQSGAIMFVGNGENGDPVAATYDRQPDRLTAAHPAATPHVRVPASTERLPSLKPSRAASYVFGPFRLDGDSKLLFRGNEPVALGLRAVGVLSVLLQHPGAPVSKDVLIETAWSGRAVEDSNLTVQIAALRRALAQGGGACWIETLPRRGYRFVGPTVRRHE
jgi:DNA-binding winged helix-turn-helix (wHTH) protein/PAS domain-containing protein